MGQNDGEESDMRELPLRHGGFWAKLELHLIDGIFHLIERLVSA
jgi:hypothetical protein